MTIIPCCTHHRRSAFSRCTFCLTASLYATATPFRRDIGCYFIWFVFHYTIFGRSVYFAGSSVQRLMFQEGERGTTETQERMKNSIRFCLYFNVCLIFSAFVCPARSILSTRIRQPLPEESFLFWRPKASHVCVLIENRKLKRNNTINNIRGRYHILQDDWDDL